ncbi:HNH endonuclease [Parasediminibacterium sp. JCM 36343]|uniref:HNH endonuclease n=1 Tax=Parasediminibacterium sp. JCM 36343 TaxID=3374279 RepID=UPI00397DBF4C
MSNKIENPYTLTDEDLLLIKDNFISHEDWDKNVFSSLKTRIRDFLRPQQENKCCYCKKELGFDIKDVDIEHIIPKATYSDFTFITKNLALSCPACNTIKGDKKVLSKDVKRYPNHSKNMMIIHSHYDNYNTNILIKDGCVFEAISKKGSHTITVCELFRLKIVEEKAKAALKSKTPESKLINFIMKATKEELTQAMAELMKRIQ